MQNILITGANRGIGYGLTKQYLESGDLVFATCRNPAKAETLQALKMVYPEQLTVVPLDVGCDQSVAAALTAVSTHTTHLDILINNAGINFAQTFNQFVAADMLQTFNVNTVGTMRVTTTFVDLLRHGEQPKLINMTSQLGSLTKRLEGWGHYGYNSSKAAINMLTRYLAFDLAEAGITTISMHPGWVKTDMGGEGAQTAVSTSVAGIINVVRQLTHEDSGKFFTYLGEEHPW